MHGAIPWVFAMLWAAFPYPNVQRPVRHGETTLIFVLQIFVTFVHLEVAFIGASNVGKSSLLSIAHCISVHSFHPAPQPMCAAVDKERLDKNSEIGSRKGWSFEQRLLVCHIFSRMFGSIPICSIVKLHT